MFTHAPFLFLTFRMHPPDAVPQHPSEVVGEDAERHAGVETLDPVGHRDEETEARGGFAQGRRLRTRTRFASDDQGDVLVGLTPNLLVTHSLKSNPYCVVAIQRFMSIKAFPRS